MEVFQTSAEWDVNPSSESELHSIRDRFSLSLPYGTAIPPDLAAVVNAWPILPEALKAGIVSMVIAARK
jgi:hypothetical protein